MAKKNISAIVNVGGALAGSLKNTFNFLNKNLTNVSSEIKTIKQRQKQLAAQKDIYLKQGKSVAGLNKEYKKLGATLTRLETKQARLVKLSRAYSKTRASFGKTLSSLATGARNASLFIGGLGTAIFGLVNSTATAGDSAIKMAGTIGINVEALQALQYAANRSGASTETLNTSIQSFSRRLGDAVKGTGSAVKVFKDFGLNASDLANMDLEQAIGLVSEKIKNLKTDTEKTTAAYNLFGRQGINLINMLNEGEGGLKKLSSEAKTLNYVIGNKGAKNSATFVDSLYNVKLALTGVKNTFALELMPILTKKLQWIVTWLKGNQDTVKKWAINFKNSFIEMIPVIKNFIVGLGSVFKTIGNVIIKTSELVGGFKNLGLILAGIFSATQILAVVSLTKNIISLGVAISSAFGPVGLIITGIVAGSILIYKNWDLIKETFFKIWNKIKTFGSGLLNFFGLGDDEAVKKPPSEKLEIPKKTNTNNSNITNDHSTIIVNTKSNSSPAETAEAIRQSKEEAKQNELGDTGTIYA